MKHRTIKALWLAVALTWVACGAAHAQRKNTVATVGEAESTSVTLDFSNAPTDWGIAAGTTSSVTVKTATEFTNPDGYTITAYRVYYYSDKSCLMLYQKGSYIILPKFDFEVSKIALYGTSGGSSIVTYNVYVGSTAVSTERTGAPEATAYAFAIDEDYQSVGTVYTLKVTNSNNLRVAKVVVSGTTVPDLELTLNENPDEPGTYYSTYSDTYDRQLLVDGDDTPQPYVLTTQTDDGDGSVSLLFEEVAATDGYYQLAANQGYLFRGKSQTATLSVTSGVTAPATNRLIANTEDLTISDADVYALNYYDRDFLYGYYGGKEVYGIGLGFYNQAVGATIEAGKAYAKLTESEANSLRMVFPDDETSSIEATPSARGGKMYDIHGRAVARPTKGLYISNGKKVLY